MRISKALAFLSLMIGCFICLEIKASPGETKGKFFLRGLYSSMTVDDLELASTGEEDTKLDTSLIGMDFGYLYSMTPRWSIGGGFDFHYHYTNETTNIWSIRLSTRYYLYGTGSSQTVKVGSVNLNTSSHWGVYAVGEFKYANYFIELDQFEESDDYILSEDIEGQYFAYHGGGGVDFRLNPNYELNFEMNFNLGNFFSNFPSEQGTAVSNYSIHLGMAHNF